MTQTEDEKAALCKNPHHVDVKDCRDITHVDDAAVSLKHHGENKTCGTVGKELIDLGSFPNGGLHQCAEAVSHNNLCQNEFVMHKDSYACSCVPTWSMCDMQEAAEPDVFCIYELDPGVRSAQLHFVEEDHSEHTDPHTDPVTADGDGEGEGEDSTTSNGGGQSGPDNNPGPEGNGKGKGKGTGEAKGKGKGKGTGAGLNL